MSTQSVGNKISSDIYNQTTINFEDFNQLFENFIEKEKLTESSTSKSHISNEAFQKKCFDKNNQHRNFKPIAQAINLPGEKDHKIENFNIYNKCIFFVNSDDQKNKTKHIKMTKELPANLRNAKTSACKNIKNPTTALDNLEGNISKNSEISSSDPEESYLGENLLDDPTECLELYTAVDNELKRIEAPLGSSGVYKKVPLISEKTLVTKSIVQKPNVFYSSTEKYGKIVPENVFNASYALLSNENDTPLECNKKKNVNDENNFNVVLTDESIEKDSLNILAYDILKLSNSDDFVIDRQNQQIIFREPKINKKTIYRMIKPESLGLTKQIFDSLEPVREKHTVQSLLKPSFLNKKRGRPRKTQVNEATANQIDLTKSNKESEINLPISIGTIPVITTRFGRTTKRPVHIPTGSPKKCLANELEDCKLLESIVLDLKDPDYKYNKSISPQEQNPKLDEPPVKRERNLPSEYVCQTCNKVFLGKRMQRHYISYPDHKKSSKETQCSPPENISLFKFLVNKVNQVSESNEKKVEVFLNEISDLVNQLQSRTSRLIYNTSGMHYVNMQSSKVLGVPEGHYTLDISTINQHSEPSMQLGTQIRSPAAPPSRIDYNLSMSLDDTLNDAKLNPSEESLLRTVEDLVKEGIKKLSEGDCDSMDNNHHPQRVIPQVIHYDHASDNAVEAVSMKETQIHTQPILDLSLDLFQFSN